MVTRILSLQRRASPSPGAERLANQWRITILHALAAVRSRSESSGTRD